MTVKDVSPGKPVPGARSRARNAGVHVMVALAVLANASVAFVPLATPLLGTVGAVAAIVVGCQQWQSRLRWMPLVLFVAAVAASLVVDLSDLSSSVQFAAPLT